MKRLKGKVAVVTGGATGIGEAIAKKFAKEGAKVVVVGMEDDPVEDVVDEIEHAGGMAIGFKKDISTAENVKTVINGAVDEWGELNILVNNAGVFPMVGEIDALKDEDIDYMLNHNIKTTVLMTKYALPELKKSRGCIVSAGSEAGKQGLANNAPYGGTKGFIHAFMQGVAVEQAKNGVRANCVCPGAIDTAWTREEHGPMTTEMTNMIKAATPMGRRGTPEEMANVYLFLASDEASYITGALVSADGGITVAKGSVGDDADDKVTTQPQGSINTQHTYQGAAGQPSIH